jgi:hypothetical protein
MEHPCAEGAILADPKTLDFRPRAPYTAEVRRLLAVAVTVLLLPAPELRAGVEIRVSGERIDVQATNMPLSEILDGLSRQAHMKIVYEGPPPRQLVSVNIQGRTPAEAVLAILEGQGVAYAVALDKTGTRVDTLLMAGALPIPTTSAALPPPVPERRVVREPAPEEPLEDVGEEGEEPELPPDTGRVRPPQAKGSTDAPAPSPGVFMPAPTTEYPTSTFAPRPPAVETQKPPKPEATPPPFNP